MHCLAPFFDHQDLLMDLDAMTIDSPGFNVSVLGLLTLMRHHQQPLGAIA
jgi:hypothetical protein